MRRSISDSMMRMYARTFRNRVEDIDNLRISDNDKDRVRAEIERNR